MTEWRSIKEAPIDSDPRKRLVFGYFGPEESLYGAVSAGYLFQWETMNKPLTSGWPWPHPPTHFFQIPEWPETNW